MPVPSRSISRTISLAPHRLSCSAAPIHDQHGHIIAVLDASCVNSSGTRESQMHTVALVNTSARLIEKCLFLRRHQTDSMLRSISTGVRRPASRRRHRRCGDGTIMGSDATGLNCSAPGAGANWWAAR